MTELDALIERARGATVARDAAERYVRELDRWARPAAPVRGWVPWLAAAVAIGIAIAAVGIGRSGRVPTEAAVQIGDRVAIVPAADTAYRVVHADADDTTIAVDRGTVTARLWPGAWPHRLALVGGGVTATAIGTVYSLAVGPDGPRVHVVEGTVEVRTVDGVHRVGDGTSWPPAAAVVIPPAARMLLALPAPVAWPPLGPAAIDAGVEPADAPLNIDGSGPASDAAATAHAAPDAAPAIKDRWRFARLLRGRGEFAAAVTECIAIGDARDPTWSPIALIEAVRIELGPLAEPERAIALSDRMLRDWPRDPLASEARELRCRALRQLGRDPVCSPAP